MPEHEKHWIRPKKAASHGNIYNQRSWFSNHSIFTIITKHLAVVDNSKLFFLFSKIYLILFSFQTSIVLIQNIRFLLLWGLNKVINVDTFNTRSDMQCMLKCICWIWVKIFLDQTWYTLLFGKLKRKMWPPISLYSRFVFPIMFPLKSSHSQAFADWFYNPSVEQLLIMWLHCKRK